MYFAKLKTFRGSKLAFIEDSARVSYDEFIARIERCMGFLAAQGVKKGDRVAFVMNNHSDFLVLFFASTAIGAVAVPLNIMLKASEYEYIFKDCQPALVVASAHLSEVFAAAPGALKSLASANGAQELLAEHAAARAAAGGTAGAGAAGAAPAPETAPAPSENPLFSQNSAKTPTPSENPLFSQNSAKTPTPSENPLFSQKSEEIPTPETAAATAGENPLFSYPRSELVFDDYLLCERAASLHTPKQRGELSHVLYTSGTTGLPKGVMLSFGNLLSNIEAITRDFRITPRDRFIAYLPMFHSFTLTAVCMLPLLVGCTLVIKRSVMPFKEVIAAIFRHRVSILFCIPAILVALSKAKLPWYFRWFNRLRIIISGGSSLAPSVLSYYEKHWRRAALIEGYGLSECSPVVSVNKLEARKAHSVGTPLSGTQVMVVDADFNALAPGQEGELVVRGECVMLGYLGKPEMTAEVMEGEWIRTGDIARMDEDGFIYILDRKKDIIISKGINIYPREIEDIICAHPAVNAAAVIGVKNNELDESVAAYVELHEEQKLSTHELLSFLRPKIAAFKMPKHVYFVDELPKNAAGKVLKKNLKERLNSEKN